MTKKDFELIARAIQSLPKTGLTKGQVAHRLVLFLESANIRFDFYD